MELLQHSTEKLPVEAVDDGLPDYGIKVARERERGLGQDGSINQMYFIHLRLGRKLKASQDRGRRDSLKVVI